MTSNLDIYVVSRQRDVDTIEQFLSRHVDRNASEDRGNEELMMLPLNLASQTYPERWDWEPCPTLHDALGRGVAEPSRAFSIYLKPIDPALQKIILAFTTDGRLIAGASIANDPPEALEDAKRLLAELANDVGADFGFVGWEVPPPLFGEIPEVRALHVWNKDEQTA